MISGRGREGAAGAVRGWRGALLGCEYRGEYHFIADVPVAEPRLSNLGALTGIMLLHEFRLADWGEGCGG